MRELDTLLTGFLEEAGPTLSADEAARFEALLELQDPLLYGWMLGRDQPDDPDMAALVEQIRGGRAA
ncbi:MAG: succinate dehydrogenase assembly factor 2 [Gammaproteobacteria bacterium]|nr:MAG: succinate dehydrogenase assembly factor 2 [Gammaproteobacteria bacterium]